ncbi:hypothetical protein D9757_012303 [Collybiopsis confluens]|uniref:Protein kinase domain-containing protein n=1 Tax=Collybiopsis confluens TaxID=2823264 RepID=A0A8H5LJ02_9AGAR|nr:hypothetical protein D9757_012303 [Collybiopsis confluens]
MNTIMQCATLLFEHVHDTAIPLPSLYEIIDGLPMSDPVSLVDNLVSNDKVLLKQSEEGTATDSLKRALAEWVAFKQKSSDAPVRIRPAYDWLGMELAQRIVDELQEFLDLQEKEEPVHRKNQVGLLRSLSQRFQILPSSLMVQNVRREGGNPVAGGGFADIWRGTLQGKTVCLKVLRIVVEQDVTVRDTIRKEFCREALIWRQLRHPNILPLLGVNISLFYPSFCLVSPWMENKDIIAYLKQNPDHSLRTALSEVAAGLRYMHSVVPPLVHGDIRGANILVTDDRRCCLADFGLSVITTSSQAWTMTTSSSSASKGTMRWLAPEYITSEIPNHPSRDIYAFGWFAWQMFTQKPPFSDRKNEAAVLLHLMGGGRLDRPQDDRYSDAIWKLTTQCWAENVQARPSAHQIFDALNGSIHVTSDSSILFKLGCDYEQQKEYDRARDTFEQIVLVDPVHTQALLRLGRLYHQDETSFQNQDLAILYVTQNSSDAQTWYLLGQAYRAGQKYNKAYEAYQQAIDQTRDALDAYSRAIRIHPYIPELWLNLGSLYETNEQVPDAIDAYNRASELDPENRDISSRIRLLRVAQETGGRLPVPLAPRNIDPIVYATVVLPPLAWVHPPALLELPNQPAVLPDLAGSPVLSGLLDQQRLLPNSNSGTARIPPPPTPQLKSSATRPSPPVTIADSSHGLLAHPLAPTQVNGPVRDDGNHAQQNFHEVSRAIYLLIQMCIPHVGSSQHLAPRTSSPFVPPSSPFEPRWSFPPSAVQAHVPRASSLLALSSALPGPPAPPASGSAVASAVASGQRYDLSPTVYPPLLKPNSKTESERQPNTQEPDAGSTSSNNSGASSPPMTMKRSRSRTPDRQTKRSRFRNKFDSK